ncbi:MAG: hypothetical protein LCH76_13850 [Actinobacteria bacterium]|nr:hypothetical protein [Actinomycetota bacterium]
MISDDDLDEASAQVFSEALGHIRNATAVLLGDEDQSFETLLLGAAALDLQGLFGDLWPAHIDEERTAAGSLAEAERILDQVIDDVPLAIWAALRSLHQRVSDGQR